MHAYEAHLRKTGKEPSHSLMKEMLAGIAAAEVDRLIETKGLDYIDRHKAHKMAKKQAHHLAHQRYGDGGNGWGYAQSQGGYAGAYDFNGRGAPWGTQGCPSYGGGGYGGPQMGGGYGGPQMGGGYGGQQMGGGYGGPQQGYYPQQGPQMGYGGPQFGGPPPPGMMGGGYPQQGFQGQGGGKHHHHHKHHHHNQGF